MELSSSVTVEVFDTSARLLRKDKLSSGYSPYEDVTKDYSKVPGLAEEFDRDVMKDPRVLKAMPGRPCYGTCPNCYTGTDSSLIDKCPMFISRMNNRSYSFFYCPDCQKYFKVV